MTTTSKEDRIVMLDKSFVDALFKLRHHGAKNQGWTINQSDSLKGNFSCHFPIGHTPSTDQVYSMIIRKDIRMITKRGSSMYTGKTRQMLIAEALTRRDGEFVKYIDEEQRDEYLSLIDDEPETNPYVVWSKAGEFNFCRPVHKAQTNLVRRKRIDPVGEKDVVYFRPIEQGTTPSRRVWYFAEPGRACFSRPGATQATPKIPEDLIQIKFKSVSATGSHWTDHWIVIGEPRPISVTVKKTSNVGNISCEEYTIHLQVAHE